jgi:D-alanyl-D-alanine carboxypeptidase/D-alanyl-D-alanine-endopeptidase (penicillin-binding protein 4)
MVVSDDVLAETVGRELARARGKPATFDGAVAAVTETLREAGSRPPGCRCVTSADYRPRTASPRG